MKPAPLRPPTARQLELHAWMHAYHEKYSMWPSVREMAAAFGNLSTNAIHESLVSMKKKGLVVHRARCARGWIALTRTESA